jgi:hypothetical protein
MCSFRLALVALALALAAGSASAQITDSVPSPNKPEVTADPVDPPTIANPLPETLPPRVSPVPEPGTLALAGLTAAGWVAYWRRKWRADTTNTGPATQP